MNKQPCFLFGGSFDPPHKGHASILSFLHGLALQTRTPHIILMPVYLSPFKQDRRPAEPGHRIKMLDRLVEYALAGVPAGPGPVSVQISDYEIRKADVSYTFDTVNYIRKTGLSPTLVLGADSILSLHQWHRWQELLEQTPVLAIARPGEDRESLRNQIEKLSAEAGAQISLADCNTPDCSSSAIRRVLAGKASAASRGDGATLEDGVSPSERSASNAVAMSVPDCIPGEVLDYIQHNGLYGVR